MRLKKIKQGNETFEFDLEEMFSMIESDDLIEELRERGDLPELDPFDITHTDIMYALDLHYNDFNEYEKQEIREMVEVDAFIIPQTIDEVSKMEYISEVFDKYTLDQLKEKLP